MRRNGCVENFGGKKVLLLFLTRALKLAGSSVTLRTSKSITHAGGSATSISTCCAGLALSMTTGTSSRQCEWMPLLTELGNHDSVLGATKMPLLTELGIT